jgi:cytoskeleton protein RodZ
MNNDNQQPDSADAKQTSFGARLKSTREEKGFDRKDAAAQLRLSEKIIAMMEYERYPADMPVTFIKGYIRAYGKLLQIPEHEIRKALVPIKAKPVSSSPITLNTPLEEPLTSGNFFMQFFTYMVLLTIVGLVGVWWYTHPTVQTPAIAENQAQPENAPAPNQSVAPQAKTKTTASPAVASENNPPAPANAPAATENNAVTQASPQMQPPQINVKDNTAVKQQPAQENAAKTNNHTVEESSANSPEVEDNNPPQDSKSAESDANNTEE